MKKIPTKSWKTRGHAILVLALFGSGTAAGDGIIVSKIYDPYVQPLETEIEWRFVSQHDRDFVDLHMHSIGFGRSLSDRWAAEVYAIATSGLGDSLSVNAYELEAKWQLTEQGEFAVDWGLLFELERDVRFNAWEASTQLLAARDIGKTTVTANVGLIYEWGERVRNEVESSFRMQARYRLKESFEPSLELHVGQDTTAAGPSFSGLVRVGDGRKLRWELGLFTGIGERSPDQVLKANLEFEF